MEPYRPPARLSGQEVANAKSGSRDRTSGENLARCRFLGPSPGLRAKAKPGVVALTRVSHAGDRRASITAAYPSGQFFGEIVTFCTLRRPNRRE